MKRFLMLTLALLAVVLASSLGPAPVEAATCTTNCSYATLTCNATTSCSSVPATSLTCDGTVTQCSAANSWCLCIANCHDCTECEGYAACQLCLRNWNTCTSNCGPKPANVTACEGVIVLP